MNVIVRSYISDEEKMNTIIRRIEKKEKLKVGDIVYSNIAGYYMDVPARIERIKIERGEYKYIVILPDGNNAIFDDNVIYKYERGKVKSLYV